MSTPANWAMTMQALEMQNIQMEIQMEQAKVRLWEEQRRQEAAWNRREQLMEVAKVQIDGEQVPGRRM